MRPFYLSFQILSFFASNHGFFSLQCAFNPSVALVNTFSLTLCPTGSGCTDCFEVITTQFRSLNRGNNDNKK